MYRDEWTVTPCFIYLCYRYKAQKNKRCRPSVFLPFVYVFSVSIAEGRPLRRRPGTEADTRVKDFSLDDVEIDLEADGITGQEPNASQGISPNTTSEEIQGVGIASMSPTPQSSRVGSQARSTTASLSRDQQLGDQASSTGHSYPTDATSTLIVTQTDASMPQVTYNGVIRVEASFEVGVRPTNSGIADVVPTSVTYPLVISGPSIVHCTALGLSSSPEFIMVGLLVAIFLLMLFYPLFWTRRKHKTVPSETDTIQPFPLVPWNAITLDSQTVSPIYANLKTAAGRDSKHSVNTLAADSSPP